MKWKIVLVCLAAVLLAGAAFAADDFHEDEGLAYTAPEGYNFDGAFKVIGFVDIIEDDEGACFKYSNGKDNVSVTAFTAKSSDSADLKNALNPNVKEKTIAGREGFIDSLAGTVTFNYLEDGKFIYITAPDESTIEKMLS